MSQKVREIVTIVFGFISGVNAIYQLLFRQDIALFIVNAIVVGAAFYSSTPSNRFTRMSTVTLPK